MTTPIVLKEIERACWPFGASLSKDDVRLTIGASWPRRYQLEIEVVPVPDSERWIARRPGLAAQQWSITFHAAELPWVLPQIYAEARKLRQEYISALNRRSGRTCSRCRPRSGSCGLSAGSSAH